MFQLISNLFNYVIKLLNGPTDEAPVYEKIIDLAAARLNIFINVITYGFIGVVLIMAGFLTSYFTLLSQYDRLGDFYFNAVTIGGLVLILLGFGVLYNSTNRQDHVKKQRTKPLVTSSPMEIALAALIQDFVLEREMSREILKEKSKRMSTEWDHEETNNDDINIQ
jgi:hypothetical protein